MNINAQWIWKKQDNYNSYSKTVIFEKTFELNSELENAELTITSDSFYRLYVNGALVNEGTPRRYPKPCNYDFLELSDYLQDGKNEIQVIAGHSKRNIFRQSSRQSGFLARLELNFSNGEQDTMVSDSSWEKAFGLDVNATKNSDLLPA